MFKIINKKNIIYKVLLITFFTFTKVFSQDVTDSISLLLSSKQSDSIKLSHFFRLNSKLYGDSTNKAINNFNIAEIYFKNNKTYSIQLIKNKSILLRQTGKFKESIEELLKGISLCDANNYNLKNQLFINLSGTYESLKEFTKAKVYIDSALNYFKSINQISTVGICYNNLANLENEQNNYHKALYYHFKAKAIREKGPININLAQTYLNIGEVYCNISKFDSAEFFTKKSLRICDSLNIQIGKAYCYGVLAQIMIGKNQFAAAAEYGQKKLFIARDLNAVDMILSSYAILYNANKSLKKFEQALEFRNRYIALNDSLFNLENTKKLLAIEYENQQRIQKEQIVQKEIIQKKENEKKDYILKFSIAFIFFLLILFVYLLKSNNNKKKKNKIISLQKQEVEKQKAIVEEHQKEILDSIHYAKRIQNALLPSEKFIERKLKSFKK